MNVGKVRILILVLALAFLWSAPTFADTFDFTITGVGLSASGTLVTDSEAGGAFQITSLTGTQNGQTMTLVGVNAFDSNDNLLIDGSPLLDFSGVSFVAGGVDYNLYFNSFLGSPCCGGSFGYYETSIPGILGTSVQFTAKPAPEPASVLLVMFGLAVVGVLARRTKEHTAA